MCRTGMCLFGIGNWIFLLVCLHLFTYAQGGEELDYGVRFTTEPGDGVVVPGEGALLQCAAAAGAAAAGAARHPVRLSWRHSVSATPTRDHGITISDKYRKQVSNGSLRIEKMSAELAGQYQCVATVDGIGTIVSRVATIFLAEVPEVRGGPRSVVGVVGGAAVLPCSVRAPPRLALRLLPAGGAPADRRVYGAAKLHNTPPTLKLNVTWLKNGSPVVLPLESARVWVSASGALELDPLRAHDAARYQCRLALHTHHAHAQHTYKTSEETELRVSSEVGNTEYPPRFIVTPQPVTVMEGASVTFDCAAVGSPKPEIIWLNNGVAIDLSDLDSRFYLVGSGSLRVQWARALDAGAYTCRAHNRLDSTDHTTHLHVLTAPRATATPPAAVLVAPPRGDVTLRCDVRGKPPPTLTWLKDGDPLTPNDHDIALVDGTSLRIQGVLRVDAGMFQCSATSPAGAATAAIRLIVLPTPHDIDIVTNNTNPKTINPSHKPVTTPKSKTNHDIFNTLISSNGDQTVDIGAEDSDFLGETSSAYTSEPIDEYDDLYEDNDYNNSFNAAEDELRKSNASIVSAPRGLRAVIVKHRFVTLTWEEPEHKVEEITGYAIVYKVKGSERERVARGVGQRHEMNVASLQPNTTYQFHALAYTPHAASPPTAIIEVITPEEEVTHGPPAWVRVVPAGPHALRVTWAPPAPLTPLDPHSTEQAPPNKYTVYYTEVEWSRSQVQVQLVEGGTECTVEGLRAAALYGVRVAAAGGAASQEVRARTPSDVPAAPPANVSALATGATSIVVRWEAPPARTHRGALTGYKVRYRAASGPSGPPAPGPPGPPGPTRRKADSLTTPADVRRAELKGLDIATTYQIRVCAINANGSGPFSEWVQASTEPQSHPQPQPQPHYRDESAVPAQPPPLTTRAGRDWISVWWSLEGARDGEGTGAGDGEGGATVRGYTLGWGLGVPDEMSRDLPAHLHSHVIRGLESNAEYVISLRASNSLGMGPAVYATVRTRAAPDPDHEQDLDLDLDEDDDPEEDDEDERDDAPPLIPPVGLKVIMLSGTTAVVYWTDPTLSKGQTATDGRRYVVRWSAPGAGGGRPRTFNATDLNCMLDDLKPFTLYEFAVKLIKGGRESSWSMLVSNTTMEAAPGSAPRDLRASPAPPASRALDLVWDKPTKPNGIIQGYVIMYSIVGRSSAGSAGSTGSSGSTSSSEDWTALEVKGERGRARVDRLRPRTTYYFKVQARNSKGLGPFSQPITYTTALDSGGGAGLAGATSAWLWASAGGACAVLALAAALALSLCCRRTTPPLSPDTSTYQKSSASAAIKPPDLWIHHDQMELKHLDKSLHSSASKISAGSVEGGSALVSSTLTLGRAPAEYEPAPPRHAPPASLDRRHYVPTYVESRSSSCAGSDDTAVLRASPASIPCSGTCRRCERCDYKPMTGMGVGVGVGVGGVGCANTCDRRQHARMPHPDQSTPLLAGVAPMSLGSPQASLASLHATHAPHPPHATHSNAPCVSGTCPLGATCAAPGPGPGPGLGMGPGIIGPGGDIYACAARERGHYVAYEPLGHYTHRDSLSSDGGAGAVGSLRRAGQAPGPGPGPAPPGGVGGPGLHSFALDPASDHSTPTHSHSHSHSHSRGSVRETSPYKKSASSSPGHIPNRLQLGGSVSHCAEELEPLTPSRSTERLHREMQNLEGLMKDLSAITQHQFHC